MTVEMTANGSAGDRRDQISLADAAVQVFGLGSVLDVGSGDGRLTEALLRQCIDAHGLEVDGQRVASANARIPGRFVQGDARAMPYEDARFDFVVSEGGLDALDESGVREALAEIRRVVKRGALLSLNVGAAAAGQAGRTRAWWERLCFEAGFQKHPRYYRVNSYESLNYETGAIRVALERMPDAALVAYPLAALEEERGLHMDMLRDTGERSDAHVIRYQWACDFIRPGDRVLDAACGLGYGGHVIRSLTRAASVTGIDGSHYAADYANLCYGADQSRGGYICGYLPEALHAYPDASFDTIISFETLEHVEDPQGLLDEFNRLLTPGGRVIVSVPNDWSDESGEDPNPYHLHVYELDRLRAEISRNFDVEAIWAQSASQAKVIGQRFVWERKQRELRPLDASSREPTSAEWWLMVGMKSPFAKAPYRERVLGNGASAGRPSVSYEEGYANPWLGVAMVTIGQRAFSSELRWRYANKVLEDPSRGAADEGAALCVLAYALLESTLPPAAQVDALLAQVNAYIGRRANSSVVLRWQVSLAHAKALLLRAQGRLQESLEAFVECASIDATTFGVHLLTKTTASWFEAGRLALGLGDRQRARELWSSGLDVGRFLLSVKLEAILLSLDRPNLFNHGDGVREYALAWDYLARCANGIHLLAAGGEVDVRALQASFASEYEIVTRDQIEGRAQLRLRDEELGKIRSELHARTHRLEDTANELAARTGELVNVRELVVERTHQLEDANAQLKVRTEMLEASVAASQQLEVISAELSARTSELVELRQVLIDRTALLEDHAKLLSERTARLDASNALLEQAQADLMEARVALQDRVQLLDGISAELQSRTARLESVVAEKHGLQTELESVRMLLNERTAALELSSRELVDRTIRLEAACAELDRRDQAQVEPELRGEPGRQ